MYASVLLGGAACAVAAGHAAGWVGWAALAAVLGVKATLEEGWLLAHHPGYADYRAHTARFVPGLY
jgi:protein-S-isoprenylcysteine O-methyltransferase Ste14